MKLIVKQLLESSMKSRRIVDSSNTSLNHFFLLLEQVLKHGLKCEPWKRLELILKLLISVKKGLFETKKDLWNVIELVERVAPDASDITSSARQIPAIRW